MDRCFFSGKIRSAEIKSLTWEGNDLLGNIRNDDVWSITKRKIAKTCGSASFSIIKKVAEEIISNIILGY